jgi:hypothetical protein
MYQRFEFVLIKLVAKNFLKRKKPAVSETNAYDVSKKRYFVSIVGNNSVKA